MSVPSSALTVRMARWSATHPWRAVLGWLVFVAVCVGVGSAVPLRNATDLQMLHGQSGQAQRWMHDAGLENPSTEDVLIMPTGSGRLDPATARAAATAVTARLHRIGVVASVAAPVSSPDGRAMVVAAQLTDSDADVAPLQAATAAVARQFPALRVDEVGSASLNKAVNDQVGSDLGAASKYSLPVTLAILLVAFGAILAAGVPVLLALSAVGASIGLSSLVSHLLPDSGTTSSMILLMGMAVGVDYSLFYVKRARAERHAGRGTQEAIEIAAQTSGHSVVVSAVAVMISMVGLFLTTDVVFASLAAGSLVVVAVAVLGSLTVLPALLMLLGRHIDRPRVPLLWRWTMSDREPRLWPALLKPSVQRPGRTLAISVVALLALAAPALGMHLSADSARSLPDSISAKQTLDRLTAEFPDRTTSLVVVTRAPAVQADAVHRALTTLSGRLDSDPTFIAGSGTVTGRTAGDSTQVLRVDVGHDPESAQARRAVAELRSTAVGSALRGIPGVHWAVGGEAAQDLDVDRHLSAHLPWVVAFVVTMTMLVMGFVFRSVVVAITTALANLLSAGVAFGVLTLVFTHHWFDGLLGYTSTGALINWIPLFTFAVLFGLSMDYHVFVLSAIREAREEGLSVADSVRVGISRSAGTVTSAAVVMVSVFAIFAGLHMVEMKELGLGLAVAVFVDALVVRVVVIPSAIVLLGRLGLWPGTSQRDRGKYMMTATPTRQMAAPR